MVREYGYEYDAVLDKELYEKLICVEQIEWMPKKV